MGPVFATARLPAQTRFLGHLTNQPELTGKQAIFGEETYYTGIEEKEFYAMNMANSKKKMIRNLTTCS